ncbi:hypothetical protein HanIR_Chr05g0240271 [Helianthus annuus]|nr:hypothetical protein HanIR_Chr05g0240271 [Helianthus annuus]
MDLGVSTLNTDRLKKIKPPLFPILSLWHHERNTCASDFFNHRHHLHIPD